MPTEFQGYGMSTGFVIYNIVEVPLVSYIRQLFGKLHPVISLSRGRGSVFNWSYLFMPQAATKQAMPYGERDCLMFLMYFHLVVDVFAMGLNCQKDTTRHEPITKRVHTSQNAGAISVGTAAKRMADFANVIRGQQSYAASLVGEAALFTTANDYEGMRSPVSTS